MVRNVPFDYVYQILWYDMICLARYLDCCKLLFMALYDQWNVHVIILHCSLVYFSSFTGNISYYLPASHFIWIIFFRIFQCIDKNAARAFFFLNAGSIGYGVRSNPDLSGNSILHKNSLGRKTPIRADYIIKKESLLHSDHFNDAHGTDSVESVPFFGYLRASVGAGVSLTLSSSITLEVTYSVPILKSSHDVIKPFQVGVGLSLS